MLEFGTSTQEQEGTFSFIHPTSFFFIGKVIIDLFLFLKDYSHVHSHLISGVRTIGRKTSTPGLPFLFFTYFFPVHINIWYCLSLIHSLPWYLNGGDMLRTPWCCYGDYDVIRWDTYVFSDYDDGLFLI